MTFCYRITHLAESGDDGTSTVDDIDLINFLHVNRKALITVLTGKKSTLFLIMLCVFLSCVNYILDSNVHVTLTHNCDDVKASTVVGSSRGEKNHLNRSINVDILQPVFNPVILVLLWSVISLSTHAAQIQKDDNNIELHYKRHIMLLSAYEPWGDMAL